MGKEINLLRDYPKTKRNLKKRSINKSPYVRKVARKFGKDFLMATVNLVMVVIIIILSIGKM